MRTIELPFGGQADVREMTGADEDLFLDRKKMADGRALNHVLRNCTTRLAVNGKEPTTNPDYEDLVQLKLCDRLAILLAIREETYGSDVKGSVKCIDKDCRHNIPVVMSTSKVTMYPRKREDFTPEGHFSFLLSDGTKITMKLLDGNSERFLAGVPDDERMTMSLLTCLVAVQHPGDPPLNANDHKKWLKKVNARYRQEMRDNMEDWRLGPDTTFMAECPVCGMETKGSLEMMAGFFFPSSSTNGANKS